MSDASQIASPTLPHFAGLTWRLDVPRASRSSATRPQGDAGPAPVYSLRLSLAHVAPAVFDASPPLGDDGATHSSPHTAVAEPAVRVEDVCFACSPDTLLALADAVEAAVKQSEQGPYRRILRLIR